MLNRMSLEMFELQVVCREPCALSHVPIYKSLNIWSIRVNTENIPESFALWLLTWFMNCQCALRSSLASDVFSESPGGCVEPATWEWRKESKGSLV